MSTFTATRPEVGTRSDFETIRNTLNSSGLEGAEVASELQGVHDDLSRRGAKFACKRLESIDKHVDALRFDVIRDVVAPSQVFEELDHVGGRWSQRISAARNVVALLPLLLTWLALGIASYDYHLELQGNSSLIGTPFLDLWQTGFGGQTWLTFDRTALIDLILLSLLVVITVMLHSVEGIEQNRASDLTGRLNHALAQLAIALQRHEKIRRETDIGTMAQEVEKAIHQTSTSIKEIGKETGDSMRAIASANKDIVDQARNTMKALTLSMSDALKTVEDEYRAFIKGQTDQAEKTLKIASEKTEEVFDKKLGPNVDRFTKVAERYEQSAETLGIAATKLGDSSDRLEQTASGMDGHIVSLDTNIRRVGDGARGMRAAARGVIVNNERMEHLSEKTTDMTQRLEEMSQATDTVIDRLDIVSQQLDSAAQRLSIVASRLPPSPPAAHPGGPGPRPPTPPTPPTAPPPGLIERILNAFRHS